MKKPTLPMDAGCRCGQVRMRVTSSPVMTGVCHCTGCQRMTGSAFSLSVMVPADGFEVTGGEPVIGGLHGDSNHHFCPHCLSWIYSRPARLAGFVNLRATMLDDTSWFAPFLETWTAEKLSWVSVPSVHSYSGFPPPEDFEMLLKSFADRMPG